MWRRTAALTSTLCLGAGGQRFASVGGESASAGFGTLGSRVGGSGALGLSFENAGSDDISDLLRGDDTNMAPVRATPVLPDPDVVEELDAGQRRQRMEVCRESAKSYMKENKGEVDAMIGQMLGAGQAVQGMPQQAASMSEEQAAGSVLFSMVISCYYTITQPTVTQLHSGTRPSLELQKELFGQVSTPPRPTRRQYTLLESLTKAEQQKRSEEEMLLMSGGELAETGGMGIIGRHMSKESKTNYLGIVGLTIVAILLFLWMRLVGGRDLAYLKGDRPPRERTAKALKKVLKAEAQEEKKISLPGQRFRASRGW